MKFQSQLSRRIVAACVVATGIAVAWGVAVAWLGLVSGSLLPKGDSAYDTLQVYVDGTPVIITTQQTGSAVVVSEQRTLDGKPWPENKEPTWLNNAYFPAPPNAPGLFNVPQPWNEGHGRVAGANDGATPPGIWWFVCDDARAGRVYVAGYDGASKLPLGYLGQNGFRPTKPPVDEQFIVPFDNSSDGFRYLTGAGQNLQYRSLPYNLTGGRYIDSGVFLLGTDRVWEIDLRERTVRSWLHFDGHLSIGQLEVAKKVFDQLPVQMQATLQQLAKKEVQEERAKSDKELAELVTKGEPIRSTLSAVRQRDRIVFFDLWSGRQKEFMLPEKLRDRRMSVFLTGPDEMLVDAHEQGEEYWSGGPIVRLLWINSQGKITREQEVRLAGNVPESLHSMARHFGWLVPVSIVWLVGLFVGGPIAVLQAGKASGYAGALAYSVDLAWVPMVAVLIVSAAVAWLAFRQQRKYRREGSVAWVIFVFLFGVPGFLAYWVEHRRAKLEACSQCGEVVPRDRAGCAACEKGFAPSAPTGTEIFA